MSSQFGDHFGEAAAMARANPGSACGEDLSLRLMVVQRLAGRNLNKQALTLARQSRNQKNFTEANEGNEEQEKFCQKCAILGNSTPRRKQLFAPPHPGVFALRTPVPLYQQIAHFRQDFAAKAEEPRMDTDGRGWDLSV
jgi:hypothetical protein